MKLVVDISELVQPHLVEGEGDSPLDVTPDAALLLDGGRIVGAGPRAQLERDPRAAGAERASAGGRAVVPGLVDSHTHVVFAGDRIDEMARRARGETYEQIAAAGGGIVRSVARLREASKGELVAQSEPRLRLMLARGTTTCEVKSGYGLDPELELKHLRAIRGAAERTPLQIVPTVLAHVIPPPARGDRDGFISRFCEEVVATAAAEGLARHADVFVEQGAYTPAEAERIAARARTVGLGIKLHVDQLSDGGGALLAARLGAASADHLEHTPELGLKALAEAGVVAAILPGCGLFLGKGPWPDGRAMRAAGCEVAVATDCNPGSSFIVDLPLAGTLAATRCGLTLEEALWGMTRGGAKALALDDRGTLRVGERADFVVVDHADWRALLYRPGAPPVREVWIGGERVAQPV